MDSDDQQFGCLFCEKLEFFGLVAPRSPEVRMSLLWDAWCEALRHKYLKSKQLGYDCGRAAIDEWYNHHFALFCRHRRLEHLIGEQCWEEFEDEVFGRIDASVTHVCQILPEMLQTLLKRANHGENLPTLTHLNDQRPHLVEAAIAYLEVIDINSTKLEPQYFWDYPCAVSHIAERRVLAGGQSKSRSAA